MKKEIIALREQMKKNNIDIYIVPTTDYHGSEYVNDHFKCRSFLTGFTGSAGTLVVTQTEAKLWTDGRYFIQCRNQLDGSGIDMMEMGNQNYPALIEYIVVTLKKGMTLGVYGRVISTIEGKKLKKVADGAGAAFRTDLDLVDIIWENRPSLNPHKIYSLPIPVTGESSESKIARVRKAMAEEGSDYLLVTKMEEIAWLFNLRGSDVENTPVFFSFLLLGMEEGYLYIHEGLLNETLPSKITIKEYSQIEDDIAKLPKGTTLWTNPSETNYALTSALVEGATLIEKQDPISLMKAIKNKSEIESTINAHIKDGVAMVNFLHYLKTSDKKFITEISAADYLENCRTMQEGFMDLSFPTISAYGSNGAIVHYDPTEETNKDLAAFGFLLVDSGAHYNDGTTDITRTIALGELSPKMKEYYTLVLASHIELSKVRFLPGTRGIELDQVAREPLHEKELDFNHGTGHGVGHILSVHEGPNTISPNGFTVFEAGMITSCEPGLYVEGEFGIRLENEILCEEADDGALYFTPITLCPFDRDAILPENLTKEQLEYLNSYHERVYETLSPLVEGDTLSWLYDATRPL